MHIGRTLPPAAIPLSLSDILNGIKGWRSGQDEIERFRRELCRRLQVRHCFLVSSGTAALFLILKALQALRPEADTVVIPAFTCYSVPSAIARAGLKAALCDIDPDSLDFDFAKLRQVLAAPENRKEGDGRPIPANKDAAPDNRLLAVIPTHLFGMAADIGQVANLAAGKSIAVIEDAAQAFGARREERFLGCRGDVGFFSLGRGKAFSAIEGGVIVTNRPELARRLEALIADLPETGLRARLRLLGYALALAVLQHPACYWLPRGLPFLHLGETIYNPDFPIRRFSAFQAGLTRGWETRIGQLQALRHEQAHAWRQCLKPLRRIVTLPRSAAKCDGNLVRLPLRIPQDVRPGILENAQIQRLGVMPSYPDSIEGMYQDIHHRPMPRAFDQACNLARELLTLPLHPYVNDRDRRKTIELLASHLSAHSVQ